MTTVVHSTSKNATGAIKYARDGHDKETGEVKCAVMSGFQTDPSNAEYQYSAVRKAYGKDNGIQARLFIQSFETGVSLQEANEIGLETVRRFNEQVDGTFQAGIYTHGNTKSPHNHIVINAVNPETGLKYHVKHDLELFRELSDQVSLEHGIDLPQPQKASRSMAERKLADKGEYVWKDDLRHRIDTSAGQATSFQDFSAQLEQNGVGMIQRGQQLTFSFEDEMGMKRKARSKRLGRDYEPAMLSAQFDAKTAEIANEGPNTLDFSLREVLVAETVYELSDSAEIYFSQHSWHTELQKQVDIPSISVIRNFTTADDFYRDHQADIERTLDDMTQRFDFNMRATFENYPLDSATVAYRFTASELDKDLQAGRFEIPRHNVFKDPSASRKSQQSQQIRDFDLDL
ncbi:relaxase/mobilization nuclease domain-containing protein [Enterococcus casseliflavus]|uniref:relaxase/mobilization nuclease domain-containing protein n=1 Tax=Enterococcus casseliflavus TaxID=37734 RepID=UPI001E5050FD|nr:relaxase/mobilization nuclease domain-containing protein [Enterococcus casseliflavus]MCD4963911.1 relaxase/mobilization nuclease domain-containing protein [Enterococcus casseliflavus]